VLSTVAVRAASADQVSNLKAQAAALAARIQSLGYQEEAMSEQYDAAQVQLQALQAKVAQAVQEISQAQQAASQTKAALVQEAVQAYVNGGNNPLTSSSVQDATSALVGSAMSRPSPPASKTLSTSITWPRCSTAPLSRTSRRSSAGYRTS
jgi:hypothetical protein